MIKISSYLVINTLKTINFYILTSYSFYLIVVPKAWSNHEASVAKVFMNKSQTLSKLK